MGRLMKTRFGLVWLGFPLGLVSLVGVMLMIGFFFGDVPYFVVSL